MSEEETSMSPPEEDPRNDPENRRSALDEGGLEDAVEEPSVPTNTVAAILQRASFAYQSDQGKLDEGALAAEGPTTLVSRLYEIIADFNVPPEEAQQYIDNAIAAVLIPHEKQLEDVETVGSKMNGKLKERVVQSDYALTVLGILQKEEPTKEFYTSRRRGATYIYAKEERASKNPLKRGKKAIKKRMIASFYAYDQGNRIAICLFDPVVTHHCRSELLQLKSKYDLRQRVQHNYNPHKKGV